MRPLPWRSTQTTCHGVSDNVRPFLGIMGLIPYACIKEPTLKTKMPRLRQERLEVANRSGQPTHAHERTRSAIPNNARLFRSFAGYIHQHVEMIGHHQTERHEPLTRHMVMPHGLQDHRRVFHKIRHATRPGTDCHEEERPRRAIGRAVIEAFTDRQVVHAFQCSTNAIPAQRAQRPPPPQRGDDAVGRHRGRYVRTGRRGRRPLPTTHMVGSRTWSGHVRSGRTHGRGGRPRPPAPPTGTIPVDDTTARAAEDVGPYQPRTWSDRTWSDRTHMVGPHVVGPRTWSGRVHGRGGRPRPPVPRRDDTGGRHNRTGRRGRRPLPTMRMVGPHMDRAAHHHRLLICPFPRCPAARRSRRGSRPCRPSRGVPGPCRFPAG